MRKKAVILFVAYNNMDEVYACVDHMRKLLPVGAVGYSICDNSPVPAVTLQCGEPDVVLTARTDNPGYLDGAAEALHAYSDAVEHVPDWVFISNSDLRLESGDFVPVLDQHRSDVAQILAPRITEGSERRDKNPHLLTRRSRRRLRANRLLTWTPAVALGYLTASAARARLWSARNRMGVSSSGAVAPGSAMYAPYGAMMVFSRKFIESIGLPSGVPLGAEEFAIAESALRCGAPVLYEPRIRVHHTPHSTTGPKVRLKRARMLSRAARYIDENR